MTAEQTRGTRAQRQAQTREQLIEVARELFLSDGYAATSLEKVAIAAGFSKGAVYSNFSGKEELCLAVLDGIHAEQVEGVLEAFSMPGTLEDRIEAFTAWARGSIGRRRWTALEVEFAAVARHSTYVASELAARHREVVSAIADLIASVAVSEGLELRRDPHSVATVLLSLGVGMGALRALDSDIDVGLFAETMRDLIRSPGAVIQGE